MAHCCGAGVRTAVRDRKAKVPVCRHPWPRPGRSPAAPHSGGSGPRPLRGALLSGGIMSPGRTGRGRGAQRVQGDGRVRGWTPALCPHPRSAGPRGAAGRKGAGRLPGVHSGLRPGFIPTRGAARATRLHVVPGSADSGAGPASPAGMPARARRGFVDGSFPRRHGAGRPPLSGLLPSGALGSPPPHQPPPPGLANGELQAPLHLSRTLLHHEGRPPEMSVWGGRFPRGGPTSGH